MKLKKRYKGKSKKPISNSENATKKALSEEQKLTIIKNTRISIEKRYKVALTIEDEKLRKEAEGQLKIEEKRKKEKQIKKQLKEIYSATTSDAGRTTELIGELKEIKAKSRNLEINRIIKRCIARIVATEWRIAGSTRIGTLTEVISATQMIEGDFLQLVAEEFKQIKEEEKNKKSKKPKKGEIVEDTSKQTEKKEYEYSEQQLEQLILIKIAEEVAKKYEKTGIVDIPQSEKIKNLAENQKRFFMEQIMRCSKQEITDVEQMQRKIQGIEDDSLEDLIEVVKRIPENQRRDFTNLITRQMERGNIINLDSEVEESVENLKRELQNLDPEEAILILQEAITISQGKRKEDNKYEKIF